MKFNEKFKEIRKQSGLSQEQVAQELSVSRQTISKWELGDTIPDTERIINISQLFHVSTDYLLLDEINTNRQSTSKSSDHSIINLFVSTTVIIIGTIILLTQSMDGTKFNYWTLRSMGLGLCIQILGFMGFELFYIKLKSMRKYQFFFWIINTWFLSVVPIIFICNFLFLYCFTRYGLLFIYFLCNVIIESLLVVLYVIFKK